MANDTSVHKIHIYIRSSPRKSRRIRKTKTVRTPKRRDTNTIEKKLANPKSNQKTAEIESNKVRFHIHTCLELRFILIFFHNHVNSKRSKVYLRELITQPFTETYPLKPKINIQYYSLVPDLYYIYDFYRTNINFTGGVTN